MSQYCEKCQVKYTAREHFCVERKVCQQCKQEKNIAEFPPHSSSFDGHKHSCFICYNLQREEERKRRIEYKQKQVKKKTQRAIDNILFRAYGYRWKKEYVILEDYDDFDEKEQWVLYTPAGERATTQEALEAIALLQVHKFGHPSTIWANNIASLPNIVTLDTETTGLGSEDEIIDIAVVDGSGKVRLNTLVQCQQKTIPHEAKAVHHINELMLRNAPTFPEFWDRLMNFLSKQEIIIYNAEYDLRMLRQTAKRYNLPMPDLHVHCLMKYYSEYVAQLSSSGSGYRSMKLAAACLHFQIPQTNAHRALADAQAALSLLKNLAEMAQKEGG